MQWKIDQKRGDQEYQMGKIAMLATKRKVLFSDNMICMSLDSIDAHHLLLGETLLDFTNIYGINTG